MLNGQNVGYIRVSTEAQTTVGQLMGVTLDKCFEDKQSGKDLNRPQLIACLSYIREGDVLHVDSIDRLARNLRDLKTTVDSLTEKGITLHFHRENFIFGKDASPISNLLLNMLGSFAEFERSLILERQKEGIRIAKAEGKYTGRKKCLTDKNVVAIINELEKGVKLSAIARNLGVSRQTIYQYLKAADTTIKVPVTY